MSESLGLTSHKSNCNCTGCGLLRAGVCINCAEKIAALILESGAGELAAEPCSGACREAIEPFPRRQSAGAPRERRSCWRYRNCCNAPPRHWRGRGLSSHGLPKALCWED
jgi:hypothetical protein